MTHSQFAGEAEITSGTAGADQLGPTDLKIRLLRRSRRRADEKRYVREALGLTGALSGLVLRFKPEYPRVCASPVA